MPGAAMDDSLSELWRRLFRMALIDWVHDFLFQTDPATLASILLSPLQATNALAMSVSATQLESGTSDVPQVDIASTWLLLPAFSVSSVSVGIVVERGSRPGSSRLVRYARCDASGDTFCICDDAENAFLEIEFLTYESPARSTRAYFQFARRVLRTLRAARGATAVDPAPLRAALLHSMVLSETRACAVCGAPPRARCRCAFNFARPQHPLDFRHTAPNTLPLLGDFRGAGTSTTFRDGRAVDTNHIATHLLTRSGAPSGATDKMIFWAVQRCLSQGRPNPLALAMPGSADPDGEESGARMAELFLCADHIAADSTPEPSLQVSVPKGQIVPPMPAPALCAQSLPGAPDPLAVAPEPRAIAVKPLAVAPERDAKDAGNGTPAVTVYGANGGRFEVAPGQNIAAEKAVRLPQKRGWIAIAPAPGRPGLVPVVGAGSVPGASPEIEYSNAERRKILKREAAARSNAKRREVVALQKSIDKEREKATALALREQTLKEENCRLRLQLANV